MALIQKPIKLVINGILNPLVRIINSMLLDGIYLEKFNISKILPVHNKVQLKL